MSWPARPFEDVVHARGTGAAGLPQSEWSESGRFRVIGQGVDEGEAWSDREDLLVAPSPALVLYGGHTRHAKYVDHPFVPGPNVKILQPGSGLEPKFLYYFLCWLHVPSRGYADHFPLVRQSRVPLPPLYEQRRIVAKLDEAFAAIDTAVSAVSKSRSVSARLLDDRLQSMRADRGRSWQRLALQDLLDRGWITDHMDGNHGSDYPRKEEFVDEGVPYIAANSIVDERVDMSRARYLSPERAGRLRKGFAKDGDVLFAHNATVGPVAILETDQDTVVLGTSLTYYRCNREHLLPEYLAHYLRSPEFRAQFMLVMGQSTRNQVPITKQREFFHVIPPIEDQRQIVTQLDGLFVHGQVFTSACARKVSALGELKQSLLHQAFTGAL